jgi:hypothetical protein
MSSSAKDTEEEERPPKKRLILPHPVRFEIKRRPYERLADDDLGSALTVKKEEIPRDCLRCNKHFVAPSRFVRLCPNCGKWATFVHNPQFEEW